MAKRSRTKARDVAAPEGEVGPRQPCPCGSGKRYKACHGAPGGAGEVYVGRPFEGLPSECDIVALRELVPAATAPLRLKDSDRNVTLCTLLPIAAPAMVRDNGDVWLALQVQHQFGDPSRDLAAVLTRRVGGRDRTKASSGSPTRPAPARACRTWSPTTRSTSPSTRGSATGPMPSRTGKRPRRWSSRPTPPSAPTSRLASVTAAYWTDVGSKEHLRWVMPEPEDRAARRAVPAARSRPGHPGPRLAAGRHVPCPRPARAGLGPRGRHRAPTRSRSRPSGSRRTSPRPSPTPRT